MKKQINVAKHGLVLMTMGWLLLHTHVQAASFDCAKAGTSIERLICSESQLSKLDDDMGDAYRATLQFTQKTQELKRRQVEWIKERNRCQTVECLAAVYRKRIQELANPGAGQYRNLGDWTYRDGVGRREPLCQALLSRLNRYDRDESLENSCSLPVIASYSAFKVPPWENLDPRQHWDLLVNVLKYSEEGPDGYFRRSPDIAPRNPDSYYPHYAGRILERGGRLRVWHARLVSHFRARDGAVIVASPGEQAIVQLYLPMSPEEEQSYCSGKPKPKSANALVMTFIFTSDLKGPDPNVDPGTSAILSGKDVVIHQGKPLLISSDSIWRDGLVTLDGLCAFEFVSGSK